MTMYTVELPCYIGQRVWNVQAVYKYEPEHKQLKVVDFEVKEGKVSMLQQKADRSWKVRITGEFGRDYTIKEFNDKVFLTEADAVKERDRRLLELSNNKEYEYEVQGVQREYVPR